MLKIRVIPVLLLRSGRMVKPIRFGQGGERDVGWPVTTARVYDSQDADELVFLDISGKPDGQAFLRDALKQVSEHCFVPLTAGGGVRTVEDFNELLKAGADKVSINTAALENPDLISHAARRFGSQCVVVSIDVMRGADATYEVMSHLGKQRTGKDPVVWACEARKKGAGEILLTAIDREGTMEGYDTALTHAVGAAVDIPVIANGGAGTRQHFIDVLRDGQVSAVAASSVFHFTDSNISQVKSFLSNAGIPVRR